jgi:hypothetical protein
VTQQSSASDAERRAVRFLEGYQQAGHLPFVPPPVAELRAYADRRKVRRIVFATCALVAAFAASSFAVVAASTDSPQPVAPAPSPSSNPSTYPTPVPAKTSAVPTAIPVAIRRAHKKSE